MVDYLLQEDGSRLDLEDLAGFLILETASVVTTETFGGTILGPFPRYRPTEDEEAIIAAILLSIRQ